MTPLEAEGLTPIGCDNHDRRSGPPIPPQQTERVGDTFPLGIRYNRERKTELRCQDSVDNRLFDGDKRDMCTDRGELPRCPSQLPGLDRTLPSPRVAVEEEQHRAIEGGEREVRPIVGHECQVSQFRVSSSRQVQRREPPSGSGFATPAVPWADSAQSAGLTNSLFSSATISVMTLESR